MAACFTVAEILTATRGRLLQGRTGDALVGVSTDSRTCQAGELFIPLKGDRHNGHDFIPQALQRGIRGVVVEEKWVLEERAKGHRPLPPTPTPGGDFGRGPANRAPMWPADITLITVPNTLTALGDLAQAWRARFPVPVVAITGSCGKTTAKEMTARVLSRAYRVLKNELNLNNLIGLPQTLLSLDATHEAVVVEMGMNRFGEIRRLTEISRPTVGVLLNVYPAHTEGVGCVEGVAQAKGELIEALNREAWLIYNADDLRVASQARAFPGRTLGFGLGPGAALQAADRQARGRAGQAARLTWQGHNWTLQLQVPGLHQLYNALAATAVGLALGLAPAETAAALAGFAAIVRRSQVQTLASGVHLLNDCYNANPGSMAMALRTLTEIRDQGRVAAALGDMLELGRYAAPAHRELGRQAAQAGVDLLVVYGNFREEVAAGAREGGLAAERIRPVTTHGEGAQVLQEFLQSGDWLLVKGSRSMRMECLIEALEG